MSEAFDFGNENAPGEDQPRTARTPAARRATSLGPAKLSIGGWVTVAGGVLGMVAALLPGATYAPVAGAAERSLEVLSTPGGGRVMWWAGIATAIGALFLRVREIRYPTAATYGWAGLGLFAGLVMSLILFICGNVLVKHSSFGVYRTGIGTYLVFASGAIVATGSVLRFVQQLRRCGVRTERPEVLDAEEVE